MATRKKKRKEKKSILRVNNATYTYTNTLDTITIRD